VSKQKDGLAKRGSKWSYIVFVSDPVTGNKKQKWISGFATKEEAISARDQARTESRKGVFVSPSKIKVKDHFEEWLEIKKTKIKASTADSYRQYLKYYILPKFGEESLKDLTPNRIEKFYIELIQKGGLDGRPLSQNTVRLVSITLTQGLERAVKDHKIALNPAKGIERPKGSKKTVEPYSSAELKLLLSELQDHRLFAFFRLYAFSGARKGEICALKWSDLDFDKALISISKNRVRISDRTLEQNSTKNGSDRKVILDPQTLLILKEHRKRQIQERMKLGSAWNETGFIFTQEDGNPIDVSTPYHLFKKTCAKLGFRPESFHSLRHLHATELLNQGIGVHLVAERLGHADVSTTLRTYAHIRTDQKKELAGIFALAIENG